MIELPEVLTLAHQMNEELSGKTIERATLGNSTHKFVGFKPSGDEVIGTLPGRRVVDVTGDGKWIFMELEPGYVFKFGDMGGRVLFHQAGARLPKKYQFFLEFDDGTAMTVSVALWAFFRLVKASDIGARPCCDEGIAPLGKAFTQDCLKQLFETYEKPETQSIKAFLINRPQINGMGNGYLQDILSRAGIHPTRKVADVTGRERRKLYQAIRKTLMGAVSLGGSAAERDFYDAPGGYTRILDAKANGNPCPVCGTVIEKIQFLGGASYFCPKCQL